MTVGSRRGSSSDVSATVKSDRVAILIDGDCGAGDSGITFVSGVAIGSGGEG